LPDVPWQRVINAQGKISIHGDGFGNAMQRALLEQEGVIFDENDRVDFSVFGWPGPDGPY
jgi:methylated-DNA-protein-cysteine methyltransferase related protein